MKLSEAIKPIRYVKANAAGGVDPACETGEPVIVTRNGRARMIIQDLFLIDDYIALNDSERRAFRR